MAEDKAKQKSAAKTTPSEGAGEGKKKALGLALEQIEKQFENILVDSGLVVIDSVGQQFNPEFHEAVEEVNSSDKPSGIIVEEISSGYLYDNIVLRPSRVKVAK